MPAKDGEEGSPSVEENAREVGRNQSKDDIPKELLDEVCSEIISSSWFNPCVHQE